MSYIYPAATTAVSDSFAVHQQRKSVNPGTDYKAAYGSRVVSVAAGTVTDADGSPDGTGGRTVHVDHDDGTGADYLHLSGLSVSKGDTVRQGQTIGYSGASGDGENYFYGPHLHISFRRNHAHGYANVGNIDFDALIRSQNTAPAGSGSIIPLAETEDPDMPAVFKTPTDDTLFLYNPADGSVRPLTTEEWTMLTTAYPKLAPAVVEQKIASALVNGHLRAERFKS